jgi:hypothetical protein
LLYNCKANVPRPSAVRLDGCPGQNTTWYLLPDDGVAGKADGYGCEEAVTTPVLLRSRRLANPSLGEVLADGFQMRYDARTEQCGACEQSGGRCRYGRIEEHGGTEFTCVCDDGANERHCGMYAGAPLDLILRTPTAHSFCDRSRICLANHARAVASKSFFFLRVPRVQVLLAGSLP